MSWCVRRLHEFLTPCPRRFWQRDRETGAPGPVMGVSDKAPRLRLWSPGFHQLKAVGGRSLHALAELGAPYGRKPWSVFGLVIVLPNRLTDRPSPCHNRKLREANHQPRLGRGYSFLVKNLRRLWKTAISAAKPAEGHCGIRASLIKTGAFQSFPKTQFRKETYPLALLAVD